MNTEKQWHIIYTDAGRELKTLHSLEKKGIECFCLRNNNSVKVKRKGTSVPVFVGYIFIHIAYHERENIKRVKGVNNFLYWLNDCLIVKDEDVFTLKDIANRYNRLIAETIKVESYRSSFVEWKSSHFSESKEVESQHELMKIHFPSYGFAICVEENKKNIRVIQVGETNNARKLIQPEILHY